MSESRLVVDKNSWHYAYYCFIRRAWGFQTAPERTSLCPYFQTIFWFSLVALVLSPILLLGWFVLKSLRTFYKVLAAAHLDGTVDFIDRYLGAALEDSGKKMERSPFITAFLTIFFFLSALFLIGAALCFAAFAIYWIVVSLPDWPAAIWLAIKWVGSAIVAVFSFFFWAYSLIGAALYWTGWGAEWCWGWLAANVDLLLTIGTYLLYGLGAGCLSIPVGYFGFKLAGKFSGVIGFKVNGFVQAHKESQIRRLKTVDGNAGLTDEQLEERLQDEKKATRQRWANVVFWMFSPLIVILYGIHWCCQRAVAKKEKIADGVGGGFKAILTPFGVLWHFAWAIKNRACPIIDFENPNDPPREWDIGAVIGQHNYYLADSLYARIHEISRLSPKEAEKMAYELGLNGPIRGVQILVSNLLGSHPSYVHPKKGHMRVMATKEAIDNMKQAWPSFNAIEITIEEVSEDQKKAEAKAEAEAIAALEAEATKADKEESDEGPADEGQ